MPTTYSPILTADILTCILVYILTYMLAYILTAYTNYRLLPGGGSARSEKAKRNHIAITW